MPQTEETPLDLPKLHALLWKEILRHHLSEHQIVILGQINRLSFGLERPRTFAWIQHTTDLVYVSGIPKNKIYHVLDELERIRSIERDPVGEGCLITLLPPCKKYPWIPNRRLKHESNIIIADRMEAALAHATMNYPAQTEFFPQDIGDEFEEALELERLRDTLLEAHQQAAHAAAGLFDFPVTARLPKSAPDPRVTSSSEGPSRPLGTGRSEGCVPGISMTKGDNVPYDNRFCADRAESDSGSRKGTLDNEQGPFSGPSLLRALKSKSNILLDSETLKSEGPEKGPFAEPAGIRNVMRAAAQGSIKASAERSVMAPLDPGADENEMMAWLRTVLGIAVMEKWGGQWRTNVRENRRAVLNACYNLRLRMTDLKLKPVRSPGGWLRDEYNRLCHEFAETE